MFDTETCSCRCDASVYHRDRLDCDARSPEDKMVWDETTCSCVNEGSDGEREENANSRFIEFENLTNSI